MKPCAEQEHVTGPVQLVCFNLGYLPGGDREVCQPVTSLIVHAAPDAWRLNPL